MTEILKQLVRKHWPVRLLVFPFLRPRRFLDEFVFAVKDYARFRDSVHLFRDFLISFGDGQPDSRKGELLIVAGQAMNVSWCQLWSILGGAYRREGFTVSALTSRNQPIRNLYFRLFNVGLVYLEDLGISSMEVPEEISRDINRLDSFDTFKRFSIDGVPFGQIALSTYSRQRATGIIDLTDPAVKREVKWWLNYLYKTFLFGQEFYKRRNTQILFFTEVFMEEYGALYYAALKQQLNVVRFAGTVRDDAIVVQHLTAESDRTHHAKLSARSWQKICGYADSELMKEELEQNFRDRYGDRWAFSKRNQPNARLMGSNEARIALGVPPDRKIAVIFSHILYDTLFFFGEDLFPCYADWFVETVKAACKNPKVQWFVKIHPSNLWRGELEHFFGGKYEEVRLIERYIGELPSHVTLVYPDTPISPFSWFEVADYGITVRGTSGIELGALGKTVITAGTGRYDGMGFTLDSKSSCEYLAKLQQLPNIPAPTPTQARLGERFAYATFCMKPFTTHFLKPVPRAGTQKIFSSDDLTYVGNWAAPPTDLPAEMRRFINWSYDREDIDFLNDWPTDNSTVKDCPALEVIG